MIRIGVLASHRGTNLKAIIDACEAGRIDARPVIVISNNSGAGALAHARDAGIQTAHLSGATHPEPDALDAAITGALQEAGVDLVVTAGYMKKLGPRTLETFRGRIVNIHPSLLPRHGGQGMYGERVHQAVLDNGDTETGITVHYVDADYDTGPIITQVRVPVVPGDTVQTLSRRILELEHRLIVDTLGELSKNDKILPSAH